MAAKQQQRKVKGRTQQPADRPTRASVSDRAKSAFKNRRPWGREAVMAAIIDAATPLFAAHGPAAVSVRDIAAAARVNPALIHRHFGSKADVLRAVLDRASYEIAATAEEETNSQQRIAQLFWALAEQESSWRTLARAILDGQYPHVLQREFPSIRRLIALLQSEQAQARKRTAASHAPDVPDIRILAGAISALTLGWLVFEPHLLQATGLKQRNPQEVRQQIVQVLQMLIERAMAPSVGTHG